jgi:hypothetical protein
MEAIITLSEGEIEPRDLAYGQSSPAIRAGASVPRLTPHSLKRAQDLSYDLPPADERKGETGDESDRDFGNPTVTH